MLPSRQSVKVTATSPPSWPTSPPPRVIGPTDDVQVDSAVDAGHLGVAVKLPDDPPGDIGPAEEPVVPEGAVEAFPDRVPALEFVPHVQDHLAVPGEFDELEKLVQFGGYGCPAGPPAAIAHELEIDGGTEGGGVGWATARKLRACSSPGRHSVKKW